MTKAWIENNRIRDIAQGNPGDIYHPDIAKHYDTEVPDDAGNGWELINSIWTAPVIIESEPVVAKVVPPVITPIAFKLLFTAPERVAIYASTDAIVRDFISLLDDPRLLSVDLGAHATVEAIDYLVSKNLLSSSRGDVIKFG